MKPIVFAFAAMIFYASQNVMLEQKLSKYTAIVTLVYFYLAMLPLALIGLSYLKITHQQVVVPSGSNILIALAVGAMFFFADTFYVSAYAAGGTLITVTTITLVFPAVASLMKYCWVSGMPNRYQIIGYALAALGVITVIKGSLPAKP